jgi:hypothetical protein
MKIKFKNYVKGNFCTNKAFLPTNKAFLPTETLTKLKYENSVLQMKLDFALRKVEILKHQIELNELLLKK